MNVAAAPVAAELSTVSVSSLNSKDTIISTEVTVKPRERKQKSALESPVEQIQMAVAGDAATAVGMSHRSSVGDCIDCKLCIAVCPTGIDIRNGTQLECVNCTACIDACDAIMDKVERPRGLIRYDSMTGIESGRRKIFTPRVFGYTAVLLALVFLDVVLIANRGIVETIILRSQGQMYQQKDETHLTNLYTYTLINKSVKDLPVELRLSAPKGQIQLVGQEPGVVAKGQNKKGVFFVELETILQIALYHFQVGHWLQFCFFFNRHLFNYRPRIV